MVSQRKNRALYIDKEALVTLALVQEGLLAPMCGLMGKEEAKRVDAVKVFGGHSFPFSFLLAPSGKRNAQVLETLVVGETIDLVENRIKVGELIVDEAFPIDKRQRAQTIFGTTDESHPGVANTVSRLGSMAVSGKYIVHYAGIKESKEKVQNARHAAGARHSTALIVSAKPLNRAHERLIRLALEKTDLVVVFLQKFYDEDPFSYEIRYEALELLRTKFLPAERVVIAPLEHTYIFAGYNELMLDALVVQNYGCDTLVVGSNHPGLSMFYEKDETKSVFDSFVGLDIKVEISSQFVYCNVCKTLVTRKACPHGMHHHIDYNSESIFEILKMGMVPPAILVRKEITALYLSKMFPNRIKNLAKIYGDLVPNSGLIEERSEREFYEELLNLHQTSSLT
jgi:sulfate adenylyltransferase